MILGQSWDQRQERTQTTHREGLQKKQIRSREHAENTQRTPQRTPREHTHMTPRQYADNTRKTWIARDRKAHCIANLVTSYIKMFKDRNDKDL